MYTLLVQHHSLYNQPPLYLAVITLSNVKHGLKLAQKSILQLLGRKAQQPQVSTQQVELQAPQHKGTVTNDL